MSESRFPDFPRDEFGKRLRGPNGRLICRGCKTNEVPKNRQSWCSKECCDRYHPWFYKKIVWDRDEGKCQRCGLDLVEAYLEKHPHLKKYGRAYSYHCVEVDFDHIIPFSEGGPTEPDNLRLLCRPCHKAVTAAWRKKKAMQRRGLQLLEDV